LIDYNTAQFLWLVIHFMIIFVCARVLWQTYGGAPRSTWWSLLSALTFASTYLMLLLGQIGGLILLGLTLFLHSVKRRAWDTAGLNVSLVSVKHHLIYLFWLAIAAASIRVRCGERRYMCALLPWFSFTTIQAANLNRAKSTSR
jgi:Glycosyltransferase family 87